MGVLQREYDFYDDLDGNVDLPSNRSLTNNLFEAHLSEKHPEEKHERLQINKGRNGNLYQIDDGSIKADEPNLPPMSLESSGMTPLHLQTSLAPYFHSKNHIIVPQKISHHDGHELEYHHDIDDVYCNDDKKNPFLTSKSGIVNSSQERMSYLPSQQAPLLQEEESHIFSVSVDSSKNDNHLISVLSSESTSSSDSQRSDSFYENITSAMSSYVASLPLSSKIFILNNDETASSQLWHHAGQQQQLNLGDDPLHNPQDHIVEEQILISTIAEPIQDHVPTSKSSDDIDFFGFCDLFNSLKELTCSEVATCTSELCGVTTTIALCNGVEVSTFSAMALSAVAGGVLCGPLGFVLGASAIGLVAGYRQISNENRTKFRNLGKKNVTDAIHAAKETTVIASKCFSNVLRDTNVRCQECSPYAEDYFPLGGRNRKKIYGRWNAIKTAFRWDLIDNGDDFENSHSADLNTFLDAMNLLSSYDPRRQGMKIKVLSERESEIRIATPIEKIHSLPPHLHVVAWMSVLSSCNRSLEEKGEAIMEILVLVKDMKHAKRMIEQGILDILLSILSNYFQLIRSWLRQRTKGTVHGKEKVSENCTCQSVASLEKSVCDLYSLVYLTSQCCIALGKSHCALVTSSSTTDVKGNCPAYMSCYLGGILDPVDNFLINMSVPDWQKLARLLYEIPHNIRISDSDGNQFDDDDHDDAVDEFLLDEKQSSLKKGQQLLVSVQWSVFEAQDVARLIACLEAGSFDPRMARIDPECFTEALNSTLADAI